MTTMQSEDPGRMLNALIRIEQVRVLSAVASWRHFTTAKHRVAVAFQEITAEGPRWDTYLNAKVKMEAEGRLWDKLDAGNRERYITAALKYFAGDKS